MHKLIWFARIASLATTTIFTLLLYDSYFGKSITIQANILSKRIISASRGPNGPILQVEEQGHRFENFVTESLYENSLPGDKLIIQESHFNRNWRIVELFRQGQPIGKFKLESSLEDLLSNLLLIFVPLGAFWIPIPIPAAPRVNAYHLGLFVVLLTDVTAGIFLISLLKVHLKSSF